MEESTESSNPTAEESPEPVNHEFRFVLVRGVPPQVTISDIQRIFGQYGTVARASMVPPHNEYDYIVEYNDPKEAQAALKAPNLRLYGQHLQVTLVESLLQACGLDRVLGSSNTNGALTRTQKQESDTNILVTESASTCNPTSSTIAMVFWPENSSPSPTSATVGEPSTTHCTIVDEPAFKVITLNRTVWISPFSEAPSITDLKEEFRHYGQILLVMTFSFKHDTNAVSHAASIEFSNTKEAKSAVSNRNKRLLFGRNVRVAIIPGLQFVASCFWTMYYRLPTPPLRNLLEHYKSFCNPPYMPTPKPTDLSQFQDLLSKPKSETFRLKPDERSAIPETQPLITVYPVSREVGLAEFHRQFDRYGTIVHAYIVEIGGLTAIVAEYSCSDEALAACLALDKQKWPTDTVRVYRGHKSKENSGVLHVFREEQDTAFEYIAPIKMIATPGGAFMSLQNKVHTLKVSPIALHASLTDLFTIFNQFGRVRNFFRRPPGDLGLIVNYMEPKAADKALVALNRNQLLGNVVTVEYVYVMTLPNTIIEPLFREFVEHTQPPQLRPSNNSNGEKTNENKNVPRKRQTACESPGSVYHTRDEATMSILEKRLRQGNSASRHSHDSLSVAGVSQRAAPSCTYQTGGQPTGSNQEVILGQQPSTSGYIQSSTPSASVESLLAGAEILFSSSDESQYSSSPNMKTRKSASTGRRSHSPSVLIPIMPFRRSEQGVPQSMHTVSSQHEVQSHGRKGISTQQDSTSSSEDL